MTFSIAGRCPRTGMFGIAITTSSICVASRCAWARAGAGAVLTQNFTDPRLGIRGLDLLGEGCSAAEAIRGLVRDNPFTAYRQLAAIDRQGKTSCFSGEKTLGTYAGAEGDQCVAVGNLLSDPEIPLEMVSAFTEDPDQHLAHRLLRALERGLEAGGEISPVNSAGLLIVHDQPWPLVDLRVDWQESPVRALRELWRRYEPQIKTFLSWALSPDEAPPFKPGEK
jgi:uncharacterized Ntn-hydrolase superfamily protein